MKLKNALLFNLKMTKYLKQASKNYMRINIFWAALGGIANILQILYYQRFIDFVIYKTPKLSEIAIWFLAYHAFCYATRIFGYWVSYDFNEREKVKISKYYKNLVFSKSAGNKLEYYSDPGYQDILYNAVYNEGTNLFSFVDSLCSLTSSLVVFASVIYLFGQLHIIFVVGAVLTAIKNCIITDKENKIGYDIHIRNLKFNRLNTYIYNLFYKKQFARELKMYPAGSYFIEKFKAGKEMRWRNFRKQELKKDMFVFLKEILDSFLLVLNITVLIHLLIHQEITVGELSLVLSNFEMLAGYIERVFSFLPAVKNNTNYIRDILKFLDCEGGNLKEVKQKDSDMPGVPGAAYVKYDHLCFSYDGKENVLKDICVDFPLDKKIALVGENGSGKSTFIKLLLGLYTPGKGALTYFYPDASIRNSKDLFCVMLQDYKIFPLSILENIAPDAEGMDTAKVEEALCFAGLEEKINSLPDGVHTVLTGEFLDGGIGFSGGEQQKLAAARAYAQKKPVLIFDEPSANLDPVAENNLIDKINHIAEGKAVVMVTHNLVYTKHMDMIYFFEDGRIVESGTAKELLMENGRYAKMLKEQMERMGMAHET